MDRGLYTKYLVTKSNGEPTDPEACYFVLRIDTDVHARKVLRVYAHFVKEENSELCRDIRKLLLDTIRTKAGEKELDLLLEKATFEVE